MIETAQDRQEFFGLEDFAVACALSGPDGFQQTINVIQNALTDNVEILSDTNIEAAAEHFICLIEDFAAVDRRRIKQYRATIGAMTYQLERASNDQDGSIVTVYLKK
jgi:hypothetical protein